MAQCIAGREADAVAGGVVQVGVNRSEGCVEVFGVARAVVHPGHHLHGPGRRFDVALLELSSASAQPPVALYAGESIHEASACSSTSALRVKGWSCSAGDDAGGGRGNVSVGNSSVNGTLGNGTLGNGTLGTGTVGGASGEGQAPAECEAKRLEEREMVTVDAGQCAEEQEEWEGVRQVDGESMVCAAAADEGGGGVEWCGRRAGSPLVVTSQGSEREVLAGLASWWGGGECAARSTVFVRVEGVRQWVLGQTQLGRHPPKSIVLAVPDVATPAWTCTVAAGRTVHARSRGSMARVMWTTRC